MEPNTKANMGRNPLHMDDCICVQCGYPTEFGGSYAINDSTPSTGERAFLIKDSGERKEFASGMVRDVTTGKIGWHKTLDGPMFKRWAEHMTKGAVKYPDVKPGIANWTLAAGEEEYQRFRESAFRHFLQWLNGDTDEDHAAAVYFNINGAEYVKEKM